MKKLNKKDIYKITGGWGPAKNIAYNFDETLPLKGLKWKFSDEEAEELKRHGYRLMKDNFGYTLLDATGSRIFYNKDNNKEKIEKILGKKSSRCQCM